MDLPPALLPVERVLVVRECASRNRADDCDYRSALHANLPHRQRALEHGGISAGLRLQSRTLATSSNEPVRMRSEFSLKRSFQSPLLPFSLTERASRTFWISPLRATRRRPTLPAFWQGTITLRLLALMWRR